MSKKHAIVVIGNSIYANDVPWCDAFKIKYAEAHKVNPDNVNLSNVLFEGCSMDFVSRVLLTETINVSPTLVLIAICPQYRTEFISEELSDPLCKKSIPFNEKMLELLNSKDESVERTRETFACSTDDAETIVEAAEGFYGMMTPDQALYKHLSNILLLQNYYRSINVPCLFLEHRDGLDWDNLQNVSSAVGLSQFAQAADQNLIVQLPEFGQKPSPESHEMFADWVFEIYRSKCG